MEKEEKKTDRGAGQGKGQSVPFLIASSAVLWLGVIVCAAVTWLFQTWPHLSMSELVYTAASPLEGTDPAMVQRAVCCYALPALLIGLAAVLVPILLLRKSPLQRAVSLFYFLAGILLLFASLAFASLRLDLWGYLRNGGANSVFIEEEYVDPSSVAVTFPEKKRNLIFLYLESMETSYADEESGGAFSVNYIPHLTKEALAGECFGGGSGKLNGAFSACGTTWTMGGMFAATSGLPLISRIGTNAFQNQESFFDQAVCLGDILEKEGYHNTLLLGSNAVFGGRRLFFQTHGGYEICDYGYYRENGSIPEDYYVFWGFEDEKLFAFARDKLTELSARPEPFNLTLLTVDSHFEDGFVCRLCREDYADQYANVIACSDRQVSAFLSWIKEQPFYEDTLVVVSGDHPTMDRDFCAGIDPSYERRVYTAYLNGPEPVRKEKRRFTTFDSFPTTLAGLGCRIEGDRLGLGVNLYGEADSLAERFSMEELDVKLAQKSEFLESLAKTRITPAILNYVNESLSLWIHSHKKEPELVPEGKKRVEIRWREQRSFPVELADTCHLYAVRVKGANPGPAAVFEMTYDHAKDRRPRYYCEIPKKYFKKKYLFDFTVTVDGTEYTVFSAERLKKRSPE